MARVTEVVTVALLAACGTDIESDAEISASSVAAIVGFDPEGVAVAEAAWLLYEELAGRLAERVVTLAELQTALTARDDEAINEMFGFTDAEMEAVHQHLTDIVERARATGLADYHADDVMQPEGQFDCEITVDGTIAWGSCWASGVVWLWGEGAL